MKKILSASFLIFSLFATSAFAAAWQSLGSRSVDRVGEMDTIRVSGWKNHYKKLQLSVRGTALDMDRMVVHFESGPSQKVNLRNTIPANGTSRVIDLNGRNRAIEKVVFWYDSKGLGRKKAVVTLLAR